MVVVLGLRLLQGGDGPLPAAEAAQLLTLLPSRVPEYRGCRAEPTPLCMPRICMVPRELGSGGLSTIREGWSSSQPPHHMQASSGALSVHVVP